MFSKNVNFLLTFTIFKCKYIRNNWKLLTKEAVHGMQAEMRYPTTTTLYYVAYLLFYILVDQNVATLCTLSAILIY